MSRHVSRPRAAGFTIVELLIAMVMMGLVMGAALTVFRSQSKNFRVGGTKMELTQNIRYAMSTIDRTLRTTGAGTASAQPMFVYGGNDVIVFNTNFASNLPDGNAVYINPDLPAGAINSITTGTPITLPNTAVNYPQQNYFWGGATPSRAETIMFYFRPDSTTADPNDYVLLERINATAPELVARNIRPYPGRPFFEFWYDSLDAAGIIQSRQLAAGRVPVYHSASAHGSPADLGASALADSIRMVRVNIVVTNGLLTADSLSRPLSHVIRIPNNGLADIKTCGDPPILGGALVATPNLPGDPPAVTLQWSPSVDETSGERDVSQYNVYFRLQAAATWDPFTTVAAGQALYNITHGVGLVAGQTYVYGVAAQDCSPAESAMIVSAPTIVNP